MDQLSRHQSLFTGYLFVIILLIISQCVESRSAQSRANRCRVRYSSQTGTPLLFGGVHNACEAGCQPRDDEWSMACDPSSRPNPWRGYATCLESQTAAVMQELSQLPTFAEMKQFSPCMLNPYLRQRTLWVIGDSLMRNYFLALRCLMLDFWDHSSGQCSPSPSEKVQKRIYIAADTNLTSSMGSRAVTDVPNCVHLLDGGRICWVQSVRGEEFAAPNATAPGLLQVLQRTVAKKEDIFLVNFGRWHFTNCHGIEEEPYKTSLHQLGSLYKNTKDRFPNLIFKVSAHDHTACKFQPKEQCPSVTQGNYPLYLGKRVNYIAKDILTMYGVPVMDTYNTTVSMHLGHILNPEGGVRDCLHYCTPGVPEWEIWTMFKMLQQLNIQPLQQPRRGDAAQTPFECSVVTDIRPPAGWSYYYDSVAKGRFKDNPRHNGNSSQAETGFNATG